MISNAPPLFGSIPAEPKVNHTNTGAATLTKRDIEMFRRLGVGIALLEDAGIERVSDRDARDRFGITGPATRDMAGIIIPYRSHVTGYRVTARLRRDNPEIEDGKPRNKYLSPYGDTRHLYFPPGAKDKLQSPETPIVLVEAEKSALALTAWAMRTGTNLLAVATGGCWSWRGTIGKTEGPGGERVDVTGALPDLSVCDGRVVYVLLDANATTNSKVQAARDDLAMELSKRGCTVKICDLPRVEGVNGPDDLIAVSGDEALSSVLDGATSARDASRHSASNRRGSTSGTEHGWPEPEPLGGELPAVPAFNVALLPESFRPLVEDTAERMQVPQDFPAVAAVLSLAGVTGRRARIQPREHDTSWIEVPNLWGGIVAPPGMMKSPVITAITRPLARIEEGWRADFGAETLAYEQQQEEAGLDRQAWRERYKAARKQDKAAPSRPDSDIAITAPTCRRLITQNATAEKLHELMQENPAGIFVIADELTGWLATLDKPGREGERGFYLSAWNGDTGYAMDRIGRGSIYVPACCASILGGIQPARLGTYLSDVLQDGPMNDGLFQRFQLLVYPDPPKQWQLIDRAPNHAAIAQASETYRQLVGIEVGSIPVFRFAADAQELFNTWLTELETTKLRGNDLHPALVAHLAKYRSLMPSLALLFHLADRETGAVSLTHARQAATWCEYLEAHGRRVYASRISPERMAAISLARKLTQGWKRGEGRFSVRDVYQNDWSGLGKADEVRAAVRVLEDAGWLRAEEAKPGTGRPSEVYAINPRIGGIHAGD